jgi:integrase
MAGRSTVYNNIVEDKYELINKKNKSLLKEWKEYLHGVSRSEETIKQYENDFKIWSVWNYENAEDKFFVEITKRDIMRFQSFCLNEMGHSPSRVRRLRATISSLSNYVESMLDDEYPKFRNIVNKIEAPTLTKVREKLVMETTDVESLLGKLVEKGMYQQACYLALSLYSGSRKSELLRFKVEYFNDNNIQDGLYSTPEKIKTKGRSKLGKMLTKYTIAVYFKPYLDLWINERKELGIDSEWLFVRKDENDKWSQAKITTANSWAISVTRVLGEPFYVHSSRHFYTTMLVKANIPAQAIKDIVGWESTELISTYNDRESSEDFGKYFGDDGIKVQEKSSIENL